MSRDEELLSLYMDDRLGRDSQAALEERLAKEEPLRRLLEEMRALQEMSLALPFTRGVFTPDSLRAAARPRWRALRGAGIAAAAVVVLALSHGGAYLLGFERATPDTTTAELPRAELPQTAFEQTERFLSDVAELNPAQPHDRLQAQLVTLREGLRENRYSESLAPYMIESRPAAERARAAHLAGALTDIEAVFETLRDPGFLSITIRGIAQDSLKGEVHVRWVPASANRLLTVRRRSDGAYVIDQIDPRARTPVMERVEMSPEEFRAAYPGVPLFPDPEDDR